MKRAFVVSDLHLGGEPGFQMCPARNRAALAALLTTFGRHRSADVDVHVVLAGDIVDFLAEAPYAPFTAVDAAVKLGRIFDGSAEVWTALAGLVRDGCTLTLMLGNHDLELALPDARAALATRLGRITLHTDGTPLRLGSAIVAHGNVDDAWNRVDYVRLDEYARGGVVAVVNLAPPGSELVTTVMNAVKRDHPWVDLLKPETTAMLPLLAVLQPSVVSHLPRVAALYAKTRWRTARGGEDDIAATGDRGHGDLELARELAGESDDIAARRMLPDLRTLWHRVTREVRAAARRRMRRALAALAPADYFRTDRDAAMAPTAEALLRDHAATTVILGHSHLAKSFAVAGGTYLNTGTWADLVALPPETWIAAPTPDQEAAFDAFVDDLVDDALTPRRTLVATYAQVDHDDNDATAALWFGNGAPVVAGDVLGRAP